MTKKKKRKDKEKISKASIKLKIYFCTNVILSLAYSWIFFFLDCFVSSTEIVINAVSIFLSFSLSLSLCKCSSAGTGIWRRGRNFWLCFKGFIWNLFWNNFFEWTFYFFPPLPKSFSGGGGGRAGWSGGVFCHVYPAFPQVCFTVKSLPYIIIHLKKKGKKKKKKSCCWKRQYFDEQLY